MSDIPTGIRQRPAKHLQKKQPEIIDRGVAVVDRCALHCPRNGCQVGCVAESHGVVSRRYFFVANACDRPICCQCAKYIRSMHRSYRRSRRSSGRRGASRQRCEMCLSFSLSPCFPACLSGYRAYYAATNQRCAAASQFICSRVSVQICSREACGSEKMCGHPEKQKLLFPPA